MASKRSIKLPKPPLGEPEWHRLDDLLVAVQGSVVTAGARMASADAEIPYILAECNLSLPLQVHSERRGPIARFVPLPTEETPPIPESQLARIEITLRPGIRDERRKSST